MTKQVQPDETAERLLIGAMINNPDLREEIAEQLRPEMFLSSQYREVFIVICDFLAQEHPFNVSDLTHELKLATSAEQKEVMGIISDAYGLERIDLDTARHFIERVKGTWRRNRLLDSCRKLEIMVVDPKAPIEEIMVDAERLLDRIEDEPQESHIFVSAAELARKAKLDGGLGFSWGIQKLNSATRGIIPGNYYAIGALKKTGKTLFGVHTTAELAGHQGVGCLVFSLEMSPVQIAWSYLSRESKIDSDKFGTEFLRSEDLIRIQEKAQEIENGWPLYIDTRKGLTIDQIIASIRRHSRLGVKVALIDYIQRIRFIAARGENRAAVIQDGCNRLADAGRHYGIALLVLSQLANRAEFGPRPTGADFKESGGIAEACDCAMILHNIDRVEKKYGENRSCGFEIIVDFQRVGRSGVLVKCKHDLATAHFYQMQSGASPAQFDNSYCDEEESALL